ncbi:hypothetical protein KC678_04535 [Candidatus Dojkabacteria bacterium]|uniref:Uncharacterized protein n=1 Tax=Candidatus Dojkabacteria bacterium TaxID=2099670 RepID=A0A955RGT7_9BACT|nr:hypothetical protein [Candidatus Dojkabacteria bacterium]
MEDEHSYPTAEILTHDEIQNLMDVFENNSEATFQDLLDKMTDEGIKSAPVTRAFRAFRRYAQYHDGTNAPAREFMEALNEDALIRNSPNNVTRRNMRHFGYTTALEIEPLFQKLQLDSAAFNKFMEYWRSQKKNS